MVADEVSLAQCAARLPVALAVVDLSLMRGQGIGLIHRIRSRFPSLAVIVISDHDEVSVSGSVLEAGANGFVLKRTIATDLLPAVEAVLKGGRYVSPAALRHH